MNPKESHKVLPLFVDGKPIDTSQFTATAAKNKFALLLDMVAQGQAVVITKHDTPKAVIVSFEEFQTLAGKGELRLDELRKEFDELFAAMQTSGAKKGIRTAFDATPEELGQAAIAAKKRRR